MFGCRFLWVYLLRVSGVFLFSELIFLASFRKFISSLLPSPSGTGDINII